MRPWNTSIIGLLIGLTFSNCMGQEQGSKETPLEARFDREKHDYAFVLPQMEPVFGAGIKAEDCAKCHKTIYQEWRQSTHSSALRDIQFQSELAKPDSPKWLCLNCHLPVQNQREYTITHLQENDIFRPVKNPNPGFDPVMQKEAITCAVCHVRWDPEKNATTILGPNGSATSPHPVKLDRSSLRNMCNRCHDPHGESLTPNLVCWFFTKEELEEGQADLRKRFGARRDCVDCHMPEKQRLLAEDFRDLPQRAVNQHNWVGSGVPKWFTGYDSLLERGYESGLDIRVDWIDPMDRAEGLRITLQNSRAGHYLPTGDPERFILTVAQFLDHSGAVLYEGKNRVGQTWTWNPAKKVGDNRLKQDSAQIWRLTPPNLSGKVAAVSVTVYHVRLNSNNAQYIMAAKDIDEAYLENGQDLVANAIDHYPFASIIYKEDIDVATNRRRLYSAEELIDLSKQEKGKKLSERVY